MLRQASRQEFAHASRGLCAQRRLLLKLHAPAARPLLARDVCRLFGVQQYHADAGGTQEAREPPSCAAHVAACSGSCVRRAHVRPGPAPRGGGTGRRRHGAHGHMNVVWLVLWRRADVNLRSDGRSPRVRAPATQRGRKVQWLPCRHSPCASVLGIGTVRKPSQVTGRQSIIGTRAAPVRGRRSSKAQDEALFARGVLSASAVDQ